MSVSSLCPTEYVQLFVLLDTRLRSRLVSGLEMISIKSNNWTEPGTQGYNTSTQITLVLRQQPMLLKIMVENMFVMWCDNVVRFSKICFYFKKTNTLSESHLKPVYYFSQQWPIFKVVSKTGTVRFASLHKHKSPWYKPTWVNGIQLNRNKGWTTCGTLWRFKNNTAHIYHFRVVFVFLSNTIFV